MRNIGTMAGVKRARNADRSWHISEDAEALPRHSQRNLLINFRNHVLMSQILASLRVLVRELS